jgi:hypothetical protein
MAHGSRTDVIDVDLGPLRGAGDDERRLGVPGGELTSLL